MTDRLDRYNLAARLEKLGDRLMTACENGEEVDNRIAICTQIGAVCRIALTLKSLRKEHIDDGSEPAGSAVRKYAAEFGQNNKRAALSRSAAADDDDDFDALSGDDD
jgi:hypothetical protein